MVSLLDGYAAKRCPQRVVFDQRPPSGVSPLPLAEAISLRQDEGSLFQEDVLNELTTALRSRGHSVRRFDLDPQASASDTLTAMEAGIDVIVGGPLPNDEVGNRKGRPDLLLRANFDKRWRYRPIEVKAHRTMRPALESSVAVSTLSGLFDLPAGRKDTSALAGRRRSNGLQLAHFYRMLEVIGRNASSRTVGVIGKERVALWTDLDTATTASGWDSTVNASHTLLERYDREFAFRSAAVDADASGSPLIEPVWVHDCSDCPWRAHCLPLVRDRNCVSTLQGVGYQAWRSCRRMGVTTVEQLADVDWASAAVADDWPTDAVVSLAEVLADPASAKELIAEGPLADLLTRYGFAATNSFDGFDDLKRFDQRVLERIGLPTGRLASHIDEARARTHAPQGACLRRGLERLLVPSFDREIDIDMESGLSGNAYLWGTYEANNSTATFDADWSVDPDESAAAVFVSFWKRLNTMRRDAAVAEQTIGFYCWHDEAEKSALRHGAAAAARVLGQHSAPDEVEAFFETGDLIDLCAIARRDLVTGGSKGLKVIAPLAGFSWRDEDPDGAASMVWHKRATDPDATNTEREQWRRRLVEYNEDDVRAEAAVRQWMRTTPFVSVDRLAGQRSSSAAERR